MKSPALTINLFRVLFVVFAMVVGFMISSARTDALWPGLAAGLSVGLVVVLIDHLLKGFSLRVFSSATFGLFIGLLLARLLLASEILRYLGDDAQWLISLSVYGICGYIGMMLAVRSNRDEFALIIPFVRFQQTGGGDIPIVVDTSILVDGRIVDVCATGFLGGSLVVPRFVLNELQRLADSSDPLKRDRGRRGLDCLGAMQSSQHMEVTIQESPSDENLPVDTRLVQLARALGSRLLTNDANLCKIARLQHVTTLNFNDLSRAIKPPHVAGEEIEILLVKEGREDHQAVGYLADGTMVVVNHARNSLGREVMVVVSSAVQTSAGRMLFAELVKA